MSQKEYATLGDVRLEFALPYVHITYLDIAEQVNDHGVLAIRIIVPESVTEADLLRLEDAPIVVNTTEGSTIFSGIATTLTYHHDASYAEVSITGKSLSVKADIERESGTFQSEDKTLAQVAHVVLDPCGIQVSIPKDIPLPQMISRENETAWEFIRRIANEQGLFVYADSKSLTPCISIGLEPFSLFAYDSFQLRKEEKNIVDFMAMQFHMSAQVSAFQTAKQMGVSPRLEIGVGCQLSDEIREYAVIGSRIITNGDLLENRLTLTDPVGAIPPAGKKTLLQSTVLTGKVLAVQGVEVLVQFSHDGPAAGTRWIPYESPISNYVYCMPNEGDQVFAYYQNDGTIICLGSKWNGEMPDFTNPEDRVLVAWGHMIKATKQKLEFVLSRDHTNPENEGLTHIAFRSGEGLVISSDNVVLDAPNGFIRLSNTVSTSDHTIRQRNQLRGQKYHAFVDGEREHTDYGGTETRPVYDEQINKEAENKLFKEMKDQQLENNILVKGGTDFLHLIGMGSSEDSGDAASSSSKDASSPVSEDVSSEPGIINIRATEQCILSIYDKDTFIYMDNEGYMGLNAPQYQMYGSVRRNYEKVVLPKQTPRETLLDWIQVGLTVGSMILAPMFPWGTVAAVAMNAVDGFIAYNRGDMIGVGMAVLGGFGDLFTGVAKGAKAAKIANLTGDAVKSLERTDKILTSIQSVFGLSTMGVMAIYGIVDFCSILKDGWSETTQQELSAWLANTMRQLATMGAFMSFSKLGNRLGPKPLDAVEDIAEVTRTTGKLSAPMEGILAVSKKINDATDALDSMTRPARNFVNGKINALTNSVKEIWRMIADPIDPITGGFYAEQTDFIIPDIVGVFKLMRRHESVQSHEKQLLGSRWLMNIGMRLKVEGEYASMLKEDLSSVDFRFTDHGWVNCWGESHAYELIEEKDGYLVRENTTGKCWRYNHNGFVVSITDIHGNQTSLDYCGTTLQRLTLSSGQYLTFSYAAGKVSKVTDCAGRCVSYEYDGEYLVSVTYPNGGCMKYQYNRQGMITSIIDQNNTTYLHNCYDEKGRVTRQDLANGEEHLFLYDDKSRQTIYINAQSGCRRVIHYSPEKQYTKIEYDDGSTEEFEYDQWGNRILEKNRNGKTVRRTFRQDGKLLRQELPDGLVWTYEYDERGNLIRWTNNAGDEFFAEYDSRNNLIREGQVVDEVRSLVQEYQYDYLGRMTIHTDSKGDQTRFTYWENSGQIASVTMPEGDTFFYTYDKTEQCMSIQSGMGTVEFGYTPLGARALEIDALGNTTRYRYDLLSNLTSMTRPNQYDPNRDGGASYRYEYDAMDHLIRTTDPVGSVFATPHDTAGRLAMEINPNTYDSATRSGKGIRYEYDTDDRRIKIIYPDGGVRRMKYDPMGNLVKVIAPEQYDSETDDGPGYCYTYDAANRLTQITAPDGTVEKRYVYDLRGLIIKDISAEGYLAGADDTSRIGILYQYDRLGRLLEKREPVSRSEDGTVQYRLTQYDYDDNGNMTAEKRFRALQSEDSSQGSIHTISFAYDRQDRLVQVSDGMGAVIHYAYNCLNKRVKETRLLSDGLTQIVNYLYDAAGRLIEVSQTADKEGCGRSFVSTKYEYDRNGNITRISLPEGGEILREYDDADRLTLETHKEKASGIHNRTQFGYDAAGNLVEITDNQGRKTLLAYDLMNREIRRIEKDGGVQRTVYDRNGNIIRLVRPEQYDPKVDDGQGFQYTYDAQGRVVTVLGPEGQVLQTNSYDSEGRLIQSIDGVGSGVKYTYDLAGAQRRIQTMGGAVQELEYDAWGNITGIVDGNRNRTQYQLDSWGRIVGVIKADGSTERYTYDFAGNMTSSTDGEGRITQYKYNRMGKISAIVDPTGERETYAYDGEGRLIRRTDRNGTVVEMGYNLYGAPLFRKEKDSALGDFYEYTPEGLLKCAISAGMRYSYTYDVMDRLTRRSASGRTLLAMAYDKNGNKISQTDVTGKTTQFSYSPLDFLTKVWDDGTELASYEYGPDGAMRALTHGPIRQEITYDLDKNITALTVQSAGTLLTDNLYQYDGNGNRILKRQIGGDTLYHYGPLNQLKKVEYPKGTEELFYDKAGNRIRRLAQGVEELYQYDPRNRLTSYTKNGVTTMFRYDKAGNLLADDKAFYSYDAFNRTTKVETFDGSIQINRYDPEGLRHEMEENGNLVRFIFNTDREVVTEQDSSSTNRLIRTTGLIARNTDSARTYYHYASDEMGSTTHIVDEAGAIQNRYEYDAWGNLNAREEQIPNRFTYYGQQLDPVTQQYYLRARFYDPVIGRFTQEDTYRGDGLNLYAYCASNPVYYVDPSGYKCDKDALNKLWNNINRPNTETLRKIEAEARRLGISEKQFLEMMQKNSRNLSHSQREIMRTIRQTIGIPEADTIMQKVIEEQFFEGYFTSNCRNYVSGFITTAEDASMLRTPEDIFYGLRLDYKNTAHAPTKDFVYLIRTSLSETDIDSIKIPIRKSMSSKAIEGISHILNIPFPFTGHGFTAAKNGQIIPEYWTSRLILQDGAELVKITKDYTITVKGTFNANLRRFVKSET